METVDLEQARAFLAAHLPNPPQELALLGAGAWSRCYGYQVGDAEFAIRFGKHGEDFYKDQLATAYTSEALPIPPIFEIGEALGGFFAISRRARGLPLEDVSPSEWRTLLPSLVDALEAMRTADITALSGVGSWGADGHAPYASWASHLLSVCEDTPDQRIYGWRRKLETESPLGWETFQWGLARLQEVADVAVPRALLHCDLLNRNVLVEQGKLTAVFDWGCGRYGDPLYDLAWFEFWAPWHPNLDIPLLRSALEQRWQEAGCTPANQQTRLDACYLHIGLDHLAYNAYLGRWETLEATAAQMRALIERNAGCL